MKKIFTTALLLALFAIPVLGQEMGIHRSDGPIVDALKARIAAYEAGDWEMLKKTSTADAQIYVNSRDPITPEANMEMQKASVAELDSYKFENPVYAHVRTAEGVDWGMFWGTWIGTTGDQTTVIPVHTVARFVDGKVVEQHGFWDAPDSSVN